MGHRLLAVDVFAGVRCVNDDLGVPVIRRGDGDGVYVLALQELAVVLVSGSAGAPRGVIQARLIDIADRNDVNRIASVLQVLQRADVCVTHPAHADHSDVDALVRGGYRVLTPCGGQCTGSKERDPTGCSGRLL